MSQRPSFGDMSLVKPRRSHMSVVDKSKTPPAPTRPCQFHVFVPGLDGCNRSRPCEQEALSNGWCEQHQHAQRGMDIGARLNYRRVEVPMNAVVNGERFKIILEGKGGWLAYFERARTGLDTVMRYLEKLED